MAKWIDSACSRCSGKKKIKDFLHVSGGVCFQCSGTGKVRVKAQTMPSNLEGRRFVLALAKAVAMETGRCVEASLDLVEQYPEIAERLLGEQA